MNFRSVSHLSADLRINAHQLCDDISLIVGIPRSGMLAASLLALHAQLPLADLDSYIQGRTYQSGNRVLRTRPGKVLVIDDSIRRGIQLERTRKQLDEAHLLSDCIFAAAYATPESAHLVDRYASLCNLPRVFEWNLLHHNILRKACVDIDGVLCRDPTPTENDDGDRYCGFITGVQPTIVPTVRINTLVTCRLSKYRSLTESWLSNSGIEYDKLVMLDLPTASARKKWDRHGEYKGEVYRQSEACLFIESDRRQAVTIANVACKPVVAMDVPEIFSPGARAVLNESFRRFPSFAVRRISHLKRALLRRLHPQSYMNR